MILSYLVLDFKHELMVYNKKLKCNHHNSLYRNEQIKCKDNISFLENNFSANNTGFCISSVLLLIMGHIKYTHLYGNDKKAFLKPDKISQIE